MDEAKSETEYVRVTDYLFSLRGRGAKFGIERMQRLMQELNHPEKAVPIIHVAGTNGKGSTCAILESIYRTAGYSTGLFTSPHLVRLGERVQVNRQLLSEQEIIDYTRVLREAGERIAAGRPEDHPTFFEFLTAMGFLQFARQKVDLAIVEVGLGGRLDASNVVDPAISVITSIGLDHCEVLGDTLEAIAREKAGIIKPGRPVVIGRMPAEARAAIEKIARERGAPLQAVEDRWTAVNKLPVTSLGGEHQRWNAALAALTVEMLQTRFPVSADELVRGLTTVDWAGRWQQLAIGGKHLILEAAHNPQGAEALEKQLSSLVAETGNRPIVALGALGERRAKALIDVASRYASELHLLIPAQPRATPFETMEQMVPPSFSGKTVRGDVESAFASGVCRIGNPGDTILLTGSIYLIGEALQRLQPSDRPAETLLQG